MRCNTSDLSPEHPKCINLKQFYSIDFALFLEMHPNKSSRRLPPTCFPLSPGKRDIAKALFSEESVPPFFTSSAFFHGTIVFYFPVSLLLLLPGRNLWQRFFRERVRRRKSKRPFLTFFFRFNSVFLFAFREPLRRNRNSPFLCPSPTPSRGKRSPGTVLPPPPFGRY